VFRSVIYVILYGFIVPMLLARFFQPSLIAVAAPMVADGSPPCKRKADDDHSIENSHDRSSVCLGQINDQLSNEVSNTPASLSQAFTDVPKPSKFAHPRVEHTPKRSHSGYLLVDHEEHPSSDEDADEEIDLHLYNRYQTLVDRMQNVVLKRLSDPEFAGHHLVAAGIDKTHLYCELCTANINPKKRSRVVSHLGDVHLAHLTDFNNRQQALKKTSDLMMSHDSPRPSSTGDALRDAHRVLVLKWFLKGGVSKKQYEDALPLFENTVFPLCHIDQLMSYEGFVRYEHRMRLRQLLGPDDGPQFSIIFDGTTLYSEVYLVIIRYVNVSFEINEPVVRLCSLARSQTGNNIAILLNSTMNNTYRLPWLNVVSFICDNVQANQKAVRQVISESTQDRAILAGCLAHMFDHVGEKIIAPELQRCKTLLVELADAPALMDVWTTVIHEKHPPVPNKTRWWTSYETYAFWLLHWPDLERFLDLKIKSTSACLANLRLMRQDATLWALIQVQMTYVVEASRCFVQATYITESDGLTILRVGQIVDDILDQVKDFPLKQTHQMVERMVSRKISPPANILETDHDTASTTTDLESETILIDQSSRSLTQLAAGSKPDMSTAISKSPSSKAAKPTPEYVQTREKSSKSRIKSLRRAKNEEFASTSATNNVFLQSLIANAIQTPSDDDSNIRQQWHTMIDNAVIPALQYFVKTFQEDQARFSLLTQYRSTVILHPSNMSKLSIEEAQQATQRLVAFPFVTEADISAMAQECRIYLRLGQEFPIHFEPNPNLTKQRACEDLHILAWWRMHQAEIPRWAKVARAIFAIQPSSAKVERRFSTYKRIIKDKPAATEGLQEATMMLQDDD